MIPPDSITISLAFKDDGTLRIELNGIRGPGSTPELHAVCETIITHNVPFITGLMTTYAKQRGETVSITEVRQ